MNESLIENVQTSAAGRQGVLPMPRYGHVADVKASDIVYTPLWVSKGIIDFLQPSGKILDPCKGDGSFYNQLPVEKDFCEIREGRDFFNYTQKCTWIIGNPPYSIFLKFLQHSFKLAANVSYLVPVNKVFQSQKVMNAINDFGGITMEG